MLEESGKDIVIEVAPFSDVKKGLSFGHWSGDDVCTARKGGAEQYARYA